MLGSKLKNFLRENKAVVFIFALFFILALSVSLTQSIWYDEGLSIEFARKNVGEIFNISMKTDLHPPLYNLFLHYSGIFFGDTVFHYRFWSGIFYLLAAVILFNYLRYKNILEDKKKYLLLALIFLSSPFALYYASESRSYILVVLISLVNIIAFDKIFNQSQSFKKQAWIYAVSGIIGAYLFYPILFLLAAQFLYVLALKRNYFKKFLLPWFVIFLAYMPWMYLVILGRMGESPSHFLAIPWWQIPAIIFVGFSGGRAAITDLNHLHDYWPTILVSLANLAALFGLFIWWKKNENREYLIKLLFLAGAPILICLLISYFKFSVFDPRYYAEVFPLFILIIIFSFAYLWKYKFQYWRIAFAGLLAANLVILGLYILSPDYEREPWKKAVGEVERELQANDAVVFLSIAEPFPNYLEYQKKDVEIVNIFDDGLDMSTHDSIKSYLDEKFRGNDRIWYSQFLEWQRDPGQKFRDIVEEDFTYIKTVGYFKVKFDLYERKNKQ